MTDHPQQPHAGRDQEQGEIIVAHMAFEQFGHQDAGEAVIAAGHILPFERDAPDEHGEGQSQHREVDLR